MAEDLYKNADPGHCVICGRQNQNNLCSIHLRMYRNRWGGLPGWITELQNDNLRRGRLLNGVPEVTAGDRTDVLSRRNDIV